MVHVEKVVYNPGDNNSLHTWGVVPDPYSALRDLPYTVDSDREGAGRFQGVASSKAHTLARKVLHMVRFQQGLGQHKDPWTVSDNRGLGDELVGIGG